MENRTITIREERISAEEYIEFLKRSDLGSQYPKERFAERISRLGPEHKSAVYKLIYLSRCAAAILLALLVSVSFSEFFTFLCR